MENFDYKKYLKDNPLLKEEEITKEDLGRTGDSLGYEGGGIPDSDVEHEDHEHEWEDTGDEEGMFTGEEECKICGLRRSVYEGKLPSEGKMTKSQLKEAIKKIIKENI